jgi:hypothetical protein
MIVMVHSFCPIKIENGAGSSEDGAGELEFNCFSVSYFDHSIQRLHEIGYNSAGGHISS